MQNILPWRHAAQQKQNRWYLACAGLLSCSIALFIEMLSYQQNALSHRLHAALDTIKTAQLSITSAHHTPPVAATSGEQLAQWLTQLAGATHGLILFERVIVQGDTLTLTGHAQTVGALTHYQRRLKPQLHTQALTLGNANTQGIQFTLTLGGL